MTRTLYNCFKLEPSLTTQWDTIKKWLRTTLHCIWDVSYPNSTLMNNFCLSSFPAAYRYLSYVGSAQNVQKLACKAQDTFFPLIAACTFFILICQQRQSKDLNFDWKWEVSKERTGGNSTCHEVHASWIYGLLNSVTGDLKVESIGAIFNAQDPKAIPSLR